MSSAKIVKLKKLSKLIQLHKQQDKIIGLIVGSFDVVYSDHVKLFRKAKKLADILVVGVDNDYNVRMSKGYPQPVELLEDRMNMLAELQSVDYVFPIEARFVYWSPESDVYYDKLLHLIKFDFWFSNESFDTFANVKKAFAQERGAKFVSP